MGNYLEKGFALILALAILFVWPIVSALNKQDDISEIVVIKSVAQFVDSVRDKGFITPIMYNQFTEQIALTGNIYDVQMEHLHKRYDPVYNDAGVYQGDFTVNYEGFYNAQIHGKLFPVDARDQADSPNRVYKLAAGDFFTVTVKNKNRTAGTLMSEVLTGTGNASDERIVIPYGGMVLNEDYK